MRVARPRVMIVDDDAGHRRMLEAVVRERVGSLVTAASAEEALDLLGQHRPDLVLLDMRMPGIGGMGFLRALGERGIALPVVVVTAFAEVEAAVEAMKLGAVDYLSKPIDLAVLEEILECHTGGPAEEGERPDLPPLPEGVVCASPLMHRVLRDLAAAAATEASVLLVGESGTGKEVLADLIHRWSPRAAAPFPCINVSALPPPLVESELFGHEKGAFTGADKRRSGYFEQAHGGTIFLDEVGDLPLEVQPKLLRVLETGRFRRLGGEKELNVDMRLISATNRDLEEAVGRGTFRRDLYYRLAVFVVEVPPLRERREDIPPLADRFMALAGVGRKLLSPAARERILDYRWPGNIRELRNSIQRAAILAPGERILPEHLPRSLAPGEQPDRVRSAGEEKTRPLAEVEKEAILEALERCGGNRTRAAAELGISRRKLLYRLKEYRRGEEG